MLVTLRSLFEAQAGGSTSGTGALNSHAINTAPLGGSPASAGVSVTAMAAGLVAAAVLGGALATGTANPGAPGLVASPAMGGAAVIGAGTTPAAGLTTTPAAMGGATAYAATVTPAGGLTASQARIGGATATGLANVPTPGLTSSPVMGGAYASASGPVTAAAPGLTATRATMGGAYASGAARSLSVEQTLAQIQDTTHASDGTPGVGLAPTNALITMFEVDATALGGSVYRFHPGTNGLRVDLVWQGNTYTAFPVEATGFEVTGQGKLPRPTLTISNVNQVLGGLVHSYRDLVGAKVTRKRTFAMYLDAVNFSGGNPTANPAAYLPDDVFYVDRKAAENAQLIQFELAAATDCHGVLLPNRPIVANTCLWTYKGTECGYSGGPVAAWNDSATSDPAVDSCGKRLSSCKLRFGANGNLPFGGFPAASRG